MKKSELRKIIREELFAEDVIDVIKKGNKISLEAGTANLQLQDKGKWYVLSQNSSIMSDKVSKIIITKLMAKELKKHL